MPNNKIKTNNNDLTKSIQNALITERPLTTEERKHISTTLQNYQQILQILEPLRQCNTHNDILDTLKEITKNETSQSTILCTDLPVGTLKTYDDKNTCYPGVHIMFTPKNSDVEIDICSIQMHQEQPNEDNKNLYVYVFDNPTNDDYTFKTNIDTTQYNIE